MTTIRKSALRACVPVSTGLALLVLASAGCGNYSNEDLEFMSALPQREDVTVAVPQQASALSVGAADGWKTTLQVTKTFNGIADAFLALIETIRSQYPTSREPNTRIWGPFPSDKSPGWQVEFRMTKSVATPTPAFTYELVMIPPAGVVLSLGGSDSTIIAGSFDASGGVRIGTGHFVVTLLEARTAGVVFDGLDRLQTLSIAYQTKDWPHHVDMTWTADPPLDPLVDVASASYTYDRFQNGDGAMTFTLVKDLVLGHTDTARVTSHWRGTGEGRADFLVVAGPEQGASSLECWDQMFSSTYFLQSWAPPARGDLTICIPLM